MMRCRRGVWVTMLPVAGVSISMRHDIRGLYGDGVEGWAVRGRRSPSSGAGCLAGVWPVSGHSQTKLSMTK